MFPVVPADQFHQGALQVQAVPPAPAVNVNVASAVIIAYILNTTLPFPPPQPPPHQPHGAPAFAHGAPAPPIPSTVPVIFQL